MNRMRKGIQRLNPDEQTHLVFTHSATEAEVLHTGSIAAIVLLVADGWSRAGEFLFALPWC